MRGSVSAQLPLPLSSPSATREAEEERTPTSAESGFELWMRDFHECLVAAEQRSAFVRERDQQVLEDRKLWLCRDGRQLELPL